MLLIFLFILLFISFALHVYFLFRYITLKQKKYIMLYINTAVSNLIIAVVLIFMALSRPKLVQEINIKLLFWLLSGDLMLLMLILQIKILRTIYRRAQDPENYHLNFFGKKVLHPTVVKPMEVVLFFTTMPIFLFAGAYFVARLMNLYLYGQL